MRCVRGFVYRGSARIAALSRPQPLLALLAAIGAFLCAPVAAHAEPLRIVAVGDSLTAGLGLRDSDVFPVKLEAALRAKGHDVRVINAGVSGDTASGGLARLDWSIPDGAAAVILELGANDALRGVNPEITHKALDAAIRRLRGRGIEVLLAGMRAPRNLGADYAASFDAIFPALAKAHDVVFYPFFLEGVATDAALNQSDGIHPNAAGVERIVAGILPAVETLIARVRSKKQD